ncbi:hypothetical protein LTS10_010087 [Elasticomyces elasticus]|nr:hypothetical protein LTS10_010087 [Elasticomyces elasticus]
MDGLNIQAFIEQYSDDKESLEQTVLERASYQPAKRREKPLPPADSLLQTISPSTVPVALALPSALPVAHSNLPPAVLLAQPKRKPGRPLGAKGKKSHMERLMENCGPAPRMERITKKRGPIPRIIKTRKPPNVTSEQWVAMDIFAKRQCYDAYLINESNLEA